MSLNSVRNLGRGHGDGYAMSSLSGRGQIRIGIQRNVNEVHGQQQHQQYEMFDVDEGSQSGSHSGSHSGSGSGEASSVGTCFEDAPSDGFEDTGRGGDLAFGDRMY